MGDGGWLREAGSFGRWAEVSARWREALRDERRKISLSDSFELTNCGFLLFPVTHDFFRFLAIGEEKAATSTRLQLDVLARQKEKLAIENPRIVKNKISLKSTLL